MQKIDNIEIKNFKSIRHQKIEGCKRVNVFIGYPNVGKSNILEAIGLLTIVSKKRRLLKLNSFVRFEKFTHLFNYFNIQNPAVITFNNYSFIINYEDESGIRIKLIDTSKKDKQYDPGAIGIKVGNETLISSATNDVVDFSERFEDLDYFNVKPYKFSEGKIFNESYSALDLKIPYGRNLFELIVNNSEIQMEFSELLKPYGMDLVIDVSNNDVKISPPIKDGIIQTIPIFLMADTLIRLVFFKAAIISNKDSVLLFEEPEAHMFPPYIAKFTTDIIFDENHNQYFIATHSPYVLEEFIEEIENDLAVYLVDYDKGETIIKRLTDEQIREVAQYGIDLFFNLESYLDKYGQPHSA
jgi:AAA15 family ATPase/GTPase